MSTGTTKMTGVLRFRPTGLDVGVLALIALLGLLSLSIPLSGDQALFADVARQMRHGDLLYGDLWDVKQPGLFFFYLTGGSLFGFSAVGLHLFELLWQLAFCWTLLATLHDRFTHRWVASLVPLLTVGYCYLVASARGLTQIEVLVAFPLYLSVWFAATADRGNRFRRLVLAGVAAAVVVYFKHLYVLIPLLTWIGILLPTRWTRRAAPRRGSWRDVGALVIGLVVPLVLAFLPFAIAGLTGRIWWTYVEYTPKVSGIVSPPLRRLVGNAGLFVLITLPLVLLALGALWRTWRRGVDALTLGLSAWIVAGGVLLLGQLWWSYQFFILLWPLGLLAAFALDELAGSPIRVRNHTVGWLTITVVVLVVSAGALAKAVPKFATIAAHGFGVTESGRVAIAEDLDDVYPLARTENAWLARQPPGAIYVIGNPVYQYLSGRAQAIPVNGWAPEQWDGKLWRWVRDDLHSARPRLVFVEESLRGLIAERSPATWESIQRDYRVVRHTDAGTWYAPRGRDG